jgi:hypothetical protein
MVSSSGNEVHTRSEAHGNRASPVGKKLLISCGLHLDRLRCRPAEMAIALAPASHLRAPSSCLPTEHGPKRTRCWLPAPPPRLAASHHYFVVDVSDGYSSPTRRPAETCSSVREQGRRSLRPSDRLSGGRVTRLQGEDGAGAIELHAAIHGRDKQLRARAPHTPRLGPDRSMGASPARVGASSICLLGGKHNSGGRERSEFLRRWRHTIFPFLFRERRFETRETRRKRRNG